jgi:hypothetical protein
MNPRNVLLIKEFMKELHEEGLIMSSEVSDVQPSFGFWPANKLPSRQRFGSIGVIHFAPNTNSSRFIYNTNGSVGEFKGAKVERRE